ncbi:hypothetical protein ACP70R_035094 [Stipagrostis hirtigluma subsp. patula]
MTNASLGTAASDGSDARSTLLLPPKKRGHRSPGGCAAGALGARNQENAANPKRPGGPIAEPEGALALHSPRAQEPAKPKRGRPNCREIFWVSKKQRSAVVASRERERGNALVGGATTASPSVQEPAGLVDGRESIRTKDHRFLEVGAAEAVDQRKEEKLWPCKFAAPVLEGMCQELKIAPPATVQRPVMKLDRDRNGEQVCWLLMKRCKGTTALCKEPNGGVDQVNTAVPSILSPGAQKQLSKCLLVQKAKAPVGKPKTCDHSDRRTTNQPSMGLCRRLKCLGITNVTPVLAKTLTPSDCRLHQARLLLSPPSVLQSPLMGMLTPHEHQAVHREEGLDGLLLEALDRHGRSYDLTLKYLDCNKAYRLITEWGKFLTQNGVCAGDLVELGAFRVDGRLMLTLLTYANEGWIAKDIEAAEGAKAEWTPEEKEEVECVKAELTSKVKEAAEGAKEWTAKEEDATDSAEEEWTPEEIEAAESLIMLSDLNGRTKSNHCAEEKYFTNAEVD